MRAGAELREKDETRMEFSWRFKKQFSYFAIFAAIILTIAAIFILRSMSGGTCFDNKQNQNEEGVDCGGVCNPCKENIKELSILWKRFFVSGKNLYEAAAMIENPNHFWGAELLNYKFKLYDKNNILIALKDGVTFLNPNERLLLMKSSLDVKERIPYRVAIEFDDINWKYIEKDPPNLTVIKKDFYKRGSLSILEAEIKNNSLENTKNIYVSTVLLDKNENAFAVSQTKIDYIPAESVGKAVFTWRKNFQKNPAKIDFFIRTDLTQ
jgi:hypothetical protein